MEIFNHNNTTEFKDWLYCSVIHDAQISCISYNGNDKSLVIFTNNLVFGITNKLIFGNISLFLLIGAENSYDNDSIISLTLEDDFSYLCHHIRLEQYDFSNSMYFVFQLLSGLEIHIVAKEIEIE